MVTKVKYLILGAGPSGLAFASRLLDLHETSFLIFEKEDEPGGLCRSKDVDGSPLDIGGGHFLDTGRKNVLEFLFRYVPEQDWELFDRVSRIRTGSFEIDYPYEANIWQLPVEDQVEHLMSIMNSQANQSLPMPETFQEWIVWKLGEVIAKNYMLPYNRKIFSIDLDRLGTYWLYKLPSVTFEDTLRSCLSHKPFGRIPAHLHFYYPKAYGYGEAFKRIGDSLGSHLLLEHPVKFLDPDTLTVNNEVRADTIVLTIPWREIVWTCHIPAEIEASIQSLEYSSVDIIYRPENHATNAHWTYFSDENVPFHRILHRHNFLKGSRGHWEEINATRSNGNASFRFHNEYSYPLNTREKPESIRKVLNWARSRGIFGLGNS